MTKEDGNRIRALRQAQGMTQGELAEAVSAGRVTINRLEQGAQEPTLELALTLARALYVPVESLFGVSRPIQRRRPSRKRDRDPGPAHYLLDLSPDATQEGQLREAVVTWCHQARGIATMLDNRVELVPLDENRRAILADMALIKKTATRIDRRLRDGRADELETKR